MYTKDLVCMANRMTFEQLFNHMQQYIKSPEERWKLVTRVKRGISNPNQTGAYTRDQSYFEGAIEILENIDEIDFNILMSGKICVDELDLISDISKTKNLKIPKFMKNMRNYKNKLRQIGIANNILGPNRIESSLSFNEEEVRKYIRAEIEAAKKMPIDLPRMKDNDSENNSSLCTIL